RLTEMHFRPCWTKTKGKARERFEQVLRLLDQPTQPEFAPHWRIPPVSIESADVPRTYEARGIVGSRGGIAHILAKMSSRIASTTTATITPLTTVHVTAKE